MKVKSIFFLLLFFLLKQNAFLFAQVTKTGAVEKPIALKIKSGALKCFYFNSAFVDGRNVVVWLPDGYNPKEKYAVLYMHDGQALFDTSSTWNKQAWLADETMGRLINKGKIRKTIVVGIYNNGKKREAEFFPEKVYNDIPQPQKRELLALMPGGPLADNYLKFIVTELKPFIDKTFSTYTSAKSTFIAGSSLGGMISLYAICEYPQIFSGAACLSTHWTGTFKQNTAIPSAYIDYLVQHLPPPANHKIYFDHGTLTLDSLYAPAQLRVDSLMKSKGYTAKNCESLVFPGDSHSELSWSKRFYIPVLFLLKK